MWCYGPPGLGQRVLRRAAGSASAVTLAEVCSPSWTYRPRLPGPGSLIALRGRIHATDSTITIGIRGPDAADRINQLRHALAGLITKQGWTTRDQPADRPGRRASARNLSSRSVRAADI